MKHTNTIKRSNYAKKKNISKTETERMRIIIQINCPKHRMLPTDKEMPENITSHGSKQKNREFFCHICDKNFVKEKKTDSLAEQVPTTNLHLQHLRFSLN